MTPKWRGFLDTFVHVDFSDEPFPHWVANDLFPSELFAEMQAMWPAEADFVPYSQTGRVPPGPYDKRMVLPLTTIGMAPMQTRFRAFWQKVVRMLSSETLFKHLLAHLLSFEELRDLFPKLTLDVMLIEDKLGYALPPHTDAPEKLFTLIVYFAENSDHPELGTSVYTTLDESLLGAKEVHHPRKKFSQFMISPYRPNGALCFLRTDNSFHGVEPLTIRGYTRKLMILTGYIGSYPEHFRY